MKKGFQKKLQTLLLKISLPALLAIIVCVCAGFVLTVNFWLNGNKRAFQQLQVSSTNELQERIIQQLQILAKDNAELADAIIDMSQKQTLLVAENMEEVLDHSSYYLKGYDETRLPDLWCNSDNAFQYSVHVRCPKEYLIEDSIEYGAAYDKEGNIIEKERIIKAKLNGNKDIGVYTVNEELYLGGLLRSSLSHVKHSKDEAGNYTGMSATYFCYEDSGIDILADLETQQMIEYDGRNSGWYIGVKERYESGKLESGEVFWTDPIFDASGRGVSVICASPVEVDGKLAGVAGSGGTLENFTKIVANSKVGNTGYAFILNRNNGKVILNPNVYKNQDSEVQIDSTLSESKNKEMVQLVEEVCKNESGIQECVIDGEKVFVAYAALKNINWAMVTVVEQNDSSITEPVVEMQGEIQKIGNESISIALKIMMVIGLVLLLIIMLIIFGILIGSKRFSAKFTQPIAVLKEGAEIISAGNLEHRIEIDSDDEIQELGESFNRMAVGLRNYIQNLSEVMAEKERIGAELEVATQIQANMLPSTFPAFPEREEFDIYATMMPAKEVGGDFYDFFLIDEEHLAVVIADVSGKGVPAALFMVIARTLIKNHLQRGESLEEVFERTNNQLCEGNEAGLFVTAWLGVLEISTGIMTCVNAGHEAPILKGNDGVCDYVTGTSGFVLAGLEDMKYTQYQMKLNPGNILFLYTDGVSEATDAKEELYGKERLLNCLNRYSEYEPRELLKVVREDIDLFVKSEPQFDDITMLALKIGEEKMKTDIKICVEAQTEQIVYVTEKINRILEKNSVADRIQSLLDITIDEVMSNIVYYSGSEEIEVECVISDEEVAISFKDSGVEYNPLEREKPDIDASAMERKSGGLGIHMVKELMDSVLYENKNGKNILKVTKKR